jgi:hypothetical protein
MDLTDLAQDRDEWRAVVITVVNIRVHRMLGHSCGSATGDFSRRTQLHGITASPSWRQAPIWDSRLILLSP